MHFWEPLELPAAPSLCCHHHYCYPEKTINFEKKNFEIHNKAKEGKSKVNSLKYVWTRNEVCNFIFETNTFSRSVTGETSRINRKL